MTAPNVRVDPAELAAASSTISTLASDARSLESPFSSLAGLFPGASASGGETTGLNGFEVAQALPESSASISQALTTISGRFEQIADAMKSGVQVLVGCDEIAATRLRSLGDLNQPTGSS